MKKLFLLMCLMASTVIASATDVWTGEQPVSGTNTIQIDTAKFADIKVGDKLVVEFKDAEGEAIELHSNGGMLPGTRYAHFIYPENRNIDVFVTQAMCTSLKEHGLEICGSKFTATKVWYGDGKQNIDENIVWTGYFWMDNWSTLEITKNSFAGVDWSEVSAIRFCSEAGRTDYIINVLINWEDGGKLGDQSTMTMTNDYAELSLDNINMEERLSNTDRLMIQCNKEGGEPFNFTDIILIKKTSTGINTIKGSAKASKVAFNLAGQRVTQPTKGLYIIDGKKVILK